MNVLFYLSAIVAIVATALVITRTNVMHALLNLILSFLAVSLMFYALGAPFIAAMEVIVYAGAIMVLFIFGIMLLNLGSQAAELEGQLMRSGGWIAPVVLALILLGELVFVLVTSGQTPPKGVVVEPRTVGAALYSTYLIGVELVSVLLLASLIGAYHIGRSRRRDEQKVDEQVMQAKSTALREGAPAAPVGAVEAQADGTADSRKVTEREH